MLKLGSIKWRGKCSRHPGYDPYTDGRGAIRANCEKCALLAEIHETHQRMMSMMRNFTPPAPPRARKSNKPDLQARLFDE